MKKNTFVITKSDDQLHFYLSCERGMVYIFSEKFHKSVYDYFCKGRAEAELFRFNDYKRNPRLGYTISRCLNPSFRKYAMEAHCCR
jgi:hypothetical protein